MADLNKLHIANRRDLEQMLRLEQPPLAHTDSSTIYKATALDLRDIIPTGTSLAVKAFNHREGGNAEREAQKSVVASW